MPSSKPLAGFHCFLALLGLFAAANLRAQNVPVIQGLADGAFSATMVAAPGSQLVILGQNLVLPGTTCQPDGLPLPTMNATCGFSATIGGAATAVLNGDATQVTIYVPWDIELGPTQIVASVEGAGVSAPFDLTIQKYAPAILVNSSDGSPLLVHVDLSSITAENPAVGGEVLSAFAVGLGNTEDDPGLGEASPLTLVKTLGTARVFLQKVPEQSPGVAQNEGEIEAEVLASVLAAAVPNTYQINFRLPVGLAGGNHDLVMQMSDADGENAVRSAPETLLVGAPPLSLNGVVNGASFAEGPIAPGTLVSAFAAGITVSQNFGVFPETAHEGLSVTFDGVAAPLFHVIPGQNQINLLAPNDLPVTGTVNVVVTTEDGDSEALEVELTEAAPGIFPVNEPGGERIFAAATLANTAWLTIPDDVSDALSLPINCEADEINPASFCGRPAKPGDTIQIYATGLGRATPEGDPTGDLLPSNETAPSDTLYWTVMTPQVTIGDMPAEVTFSGLSPGYAGLYQLNVVVPEGAPTGDDITIEIAMPNGTSTTALIAIQP